MVKVSASMNPRSDTRTPPDGDEHLVHLELVRATGSLERDDDAAVGVLQLANPRGRVDRRAASGEVPRQEVRHLAVGADRQDTLRKGLQQRGLHAKVGVYGRELRPDHAAADDSDPLRQPVSVAVRAVVGRDDLVAVDVHAGYGTGDRTGADDHGTAAERLPLHHHRAVRGQPSPARDDRDLAPLEQAAQALVQLVDDAGLAGVERRPVRRRPRAVGQGDPEVAGVADRPEHLGGLQQRLRGDAATVEARPTDLLRLDERDLEPGRRRVEGGRVTTRPTTEDDDVVLAHAVATFLSTCAISAGCGTTASSSGGLVGVGVFLAAMRATGWSRCQKHSDWITAVISAP